MNGYSAEDPLLEDRYSPEIQEGPEHEFSYQGIRDLEDEEDLETIIRQRIKEWESHYNDARYFGDSHFIQKCDCVLTILKNILEEGGCR